MVGRVHSAAMTIATSEAPGLERKLLACEAEPEAVRRFLPGVLPVPVADVLSPTRVSSRTSSWMSSPSTGLGMVPNRRPSASG